jgi:hypothetical protein
MCPNIPPDYPYCDYVTDMMRPVRTWGETYYTTTPIQPQGISAGHNSAMYLIVATKNNQAIHIFNTAMGDSVVCTIDSQYHVFWAEESNANKWYSDAPFMLVQYINSATYPDGNNGNGDPAEAVISPRESYPKNVFYIAPPGVGSQADYVNYANIIVNNKDVGNVTFDENSIKSYTHQNIDDTFSIYLIPNLTTAAAHIVKSDSGVGVYGYGYGYDETFSWGGSSGAATFNSPDTTPPIALFSSNCFGANVHLADTGTFTSKISEISLDSDVNMLYLGDTNFLAGVGYDSSDCSMSVVDITKPAILKISAFDFAGNRTTVTSIYSPQIAAIQPALQNFGSTLSSDSPIVLYDTLVNTGTLPIKLSNLSLLHGNVGFTIDSTGGSDTVIAGEHRPIKISFLPVKTTLAVDSIIYFDECFRYSSALVGSGGADDFYISDANWGNVQYPKYKSGSWVAMGATIHNLSRQDTLDVDTAGWTDRVHFPLLPNQHFPVRVSPIGTAGDTASVWFYFEPANVGHDTAIASWASPQIRNSDSSLVIRYDRLTGYGAAPALTFTSDTDVRLVCPSASDSIVPLYFLLSNSGSESAVIQKVTVSDPTDFTGLTGHVEFGPTWDPARQAENIDAGQTDTFTVDFHFNPLINNLSASTNITAFGISGDTLGGSSLEATVSVMHPGDTVSTTELDFGNLEWMGAEVTKSFTITNTTASNLAVNGFAFASGLLPGTYYYTLSPPLPDTMAPGQILTVNVTFNPSVLDSIQQSFLEINTNSCNGFQGVTLNAIVTNPGLGVAEENALPSTASILQLDDDRSIQVIIPPDWTIPVRLDIYNILGETVYSASFNGTSNFDLSALTHGVYFYRLRNGEINQTGKTLLNQ